MTAAVTYDYRCVHGVRKYHCRQCGGSALCEHGFHKRNCRRCSGWRCDEPLCPHFGRGCSGAGGYRQHCRTHHGRLFLSDLLAAVGHPASPRAAADGRGVPPQKSAEPAA